MLVLRVKPGEYLLIHRPGEQMRLTSTDLPAGRGVACILRDAAGVTIGRAVRMHDGGFGCVVIGVQAPKEWQVTRMRGDACGEGLARRLTEMRATR